MKNVQKQARSTCIQFKRNIYALNFRVIFFCILNASKVIVVEM